VAREYALSHSEREQNRYADYYNLRSKDKHFEVGDQVLILMPDSTASKVFSKWLGPARVTDVRSPYRYLVEYDGVKRQFHANSAVNSTCGSSQPLVTQWCVIVLVLVMNVISL